MEAQINSLSKIEYTAAIEDISVKLSIDRFVGAANELASLTKHTHAYSELFVCIDGQLILEVGEQRITLNSADAAFVPPDLYHHKLIEGGDAVWCALGFEIAVNQRRSTSGLSRLFMGIYDGTHAQVMRDAPGFCREIYQLCTEPAPLHTCLPAIEFTLLLAKYAKKLSGVSPSAALPSPDSDLNRIALLETMVNAKFMTDITPGAVADALHISTRQLSRIVKKRFGTTFTRVILDKRLETAAKLLAETQQTVGAIAGVVGFSSAAFMYREFKAKYHMTPMEYRNAR